ncbi:MAG: AbgT family transporter [Epulopiscium sp.]|nr:AbgT family transporter [Candidatus Epulonipiscium sp.]
MSNQKISIGQKMMNIIEEKGNKLWDPVTLFAVICLLTMVLSFILFKLDVTAIHPGTQETIAVTNLLSKESLQWLIGSISTNFQGFPPLALVIIVMLGVGVADKSGLLGSFMKNTVIRAPKSLVTGIIVFIGLNAVAAGDSGPIVLPPLAAAIFLALGRHPLAGMYMAFAAVQVGFTACVMIQMGDVIAASFTIPAAQLVDPNFVGTPAMNYYFMFISTFILVPVLILVNNKIIEPRLGVYKATAQVDTDMNSELQPLEKKGLRWAGISLLALGLFSILLSVGENAFLKDPATGSLLTFEAPLMLGIVPLVTLIFLVPGIVYGLVTKSIKNDKDVVSMMGQSISEMGGYIVLAFAASQMLGLFQKSNLGVILSIKGAEFLQRIGLTGIGLFIAFLVLTSILNLFLGSAGAKWAIMAPIFVPMFMFLGYSPAFTQVVYRIGDSITNGISPLFPTFALLIAYAKKYDKSVGVGTIVSNMIPYTIFTALAWMILMIIFMVLNLPLGPGAGIYL